MDKQLVRYQRKRKDRVVQPFQGHLTEYIHSQEAAAMVPESGPGEPLLSPYVSNHLSALLTRLTFIQVLFLDLVNAI